MNVNGQRSRLPVPTLKTTTVTPAKLDKKKNNNKSNSLFSTTCSRMAQELKNYNNRKPANSNRRLSSISLSKMNKPPAKTLTIDKKKSTPLKNPTTTSKRKSPVTQLQEDLESLRQKV
jgi:hypothetical protein